MTEKRFRTLEKYMLECADGQAHDSEHIYRVLWSALQIAEGENGVDRDILIAACLLHDVGRPEQLADQTLCHAEVGAKKAYEFLVGNSWNEQDAKRIEACILTHRFRSGREPVSIEAKILFDADKLDSTGILGIARTLQYKAVLGNPIYTFDESGEIRDGTNENSESLFHEYCFKLQKLYGRFYTESGLKMALERRENAVKCYEGLLAEVRSSYAGRQLISFDEG